MPRFIPTARARCFAIGCVDGFETFTTIAGSRRTARCTVCR